MTNSQNYNVETDLIGIKERYITASAEFRTMMFNHLVNVAATLQDEVELRKREKRAAQGRAVRLGHELAKIRADQPEPIWSCSDIEE